MLGSHVGLHFWPWQLINGTKSSGSRVNQLRLFLDDKKIIRCEGRIENSSAAIDAKKQKNCLKKSIGRATLSFEELRTILVEIESTINNRPITYIYDDGEGVSYPLMPSCLLYEQRTSTTANENQFEIVSTNESLTRRAKHHKKLLTEFLNQWKKEYLPSVRESARLNNPNDNDISIEEIL